MKRQLQRTLVQPLMTILRDIMDKNFRLRTVVVVAAALGVRSSATRRSYRRDCGHKLLPVVGTKKALIVRFAVACLLRTERRDYKLKHLTTNSKSRLSILLFVSRLHSDSCRLLMCLRQKLRPFITFITLSAFEEGIRVSFAAMTLDSAEAGR